MTAVGTDHLTCGHRECAQADERILTPPTIVTFVRTLATLVLALLGAHDGSLDLLLASLAVYWVGDMADGGLARMTGRETRTGAQLDIICDRMSAACFCVGFAWYDPTMVLPVGIYLSEFLVIDLYLSLAFLAWPIRSPNYFYLVDRTLWIWNWSVPGKMLNSSLFAVLMVATRNVWLASAIAAVMLSAKLASTVRLSRIGLPVPTGCAHALHDERSAARV